MVKSFTDADVAEFLYSELDHIETWNGSDWEIDAINAWDDVRENWDHIREVDLGDFFVRIKKLKDTLFRDNG